jgi:hypothetical protein
MVKLPNAREMGWIAAVAWLSALVMGVAALKLGGVARPVALVWLLGAVIWTLLTVVRALGGRARE